MCNLDDNNFHDQDIALIHTQLHSDEFFISCQLGVGGNHVGVGGLEDVLGDFAGGIGGFPGAPGEMVEGIGGKGVEFHDQHVEKVWRLVEGGDMKGGSGVESSAESLGMEGIGRIMHGGIDMEDSKNRLGDCRLILRRNVALESED